MAFTISEGSFEPTVMFFGLTNSPATFQTIINEILRGLINIEQVASFINNMIVGIEEKEEYDKMVEKVIKRIEENNLYMQATVLLFPSLYTATVVDLDTLHQDILSALPSDPIATKHISADGRWSMDPNSLLLLNNRIYVPFAGNLHTCILQYNHDHILAGYFGQNKTLELVCRGYSWPCLHVDVQQFCKSCVTCMRSKPQHYKLYRSLKQLPIPE